MMRIYVPAHFRVFCRVCRAQPVAPMGTVVAVTAVTHVGFRELRSQFRAAPAAGSADEIRLNVGEPGMIGPTIGADRD